MQTEYKSASGQLTYAVHPSIKMLTGEYLNLSSVSTDEYIAYLKAAGEAMESHQIGKFLLDLSRMSHFGITLRAAAINNVNNFVIKKAPFFLLGIVKPKNMFEQLASEAALKAAKPLSKKFLDGRLFNSWHEAMTWLDSYHIPQSLTSTKS